MVIEQVVDMAARALELDPAEIRRRNYIPPESFPYIIPSGNEYDSGDYEATLDAVLELAALPTSCARSRAAAAREGRLVGIGVANGIEPGVFDWNAYAMVGMPNIGVPEGVTVSIDVLGKITVRVGFTPEGQGQYTLAAQLLADYFGTELEDISVVAARHRGGAAALRPGWEPARCGLTGAILGACKKLEEKLVQIAAGLLQPRPRTSSSSTACCASRACPARRWRWPTWPASPTRAAICCRRAWSRASRPPTSGPPPTASPSTSCSARRAT